MCLRRKVVFGSVDVYRDNRARSVQQCNMLNELFGFRIGMDWGERARSTTYTYQGFAI